MQTINTALLSFGMSGKVFHAPFIAVHNGFHLMGSWERSQKNIQQIYPDTTSYPTLESLLDDKKVQLVIVNTPNQTHYHYAKAAMLAGKDVIVEKAFTTTVQEAVELKQLAKKLHRNISVYQNRRFDSDCRTLQAVLKQGLLGEIVDAEFRYDRYKPVIGLKQHKETAGAGAGLLNDLGPHLIDQTITLFGMPQQVFADVRITRPHSQVDDSFELLLYYPTMRVRLKSGMFVREATPANVLQGTKGSFIKSRGDVQETKLLEGLQPYGKDWGVETAATYGLLHTDIEGIIFKDKIPSAAGNYLDFYEEYYLSVTTGSPMPVTCDEAIDIMKIIEAAIKSNDEKRVVAVSEL